jgi:hypothetical protein
LLRILFDRFAATLQVADLLRLHFVGQDRRLLLQLLLGWGMPCGGGPA